jgi:hypothetical protein
MFWHSFVNWLHDNEAFAVWLEGFALFFILGLDWWEYRKQGQERIKQDADRSAQHKETAAQMEIWRKQIHADRVAEIFKVLRQFRQAIPARVNGLETQAHGIE